jgi:hypothetical protein
MALVTTLLSAINDILANDMFLKNVEKGLVMFKKAEKFPDFTSSPFIRVKVPKIDDRAHVDTYDMKESLLSLLDMENLTTSSMVSHSSWTSSFT